MKQSVSLTRFSLLYGGMVFLLQGVFLSKAVVATEAFRLAIANSCAIQGGII
jgi:hypothetical protein